jgi:tripartite-type tricarboxylate transporter receptor subunit TctC
VAATGKNYTLRAGRHPYGKSFRTDMMQPKRLLLAWASTAILMATPAAAQTYPSKPVTLVVALAPGGAADVIARAVAQKLTDAWGQTFVIENRGGANTQLAAEYVGKTAPDGYTLLVTAEHTFTVNPSLYKKLSYDPMKGFVPVSGLIAVSQTLVANPSAPFNSVAELVAQAKARPGQISYGSLGVGSGPHLSAVLLENAAGIKLNAVQYRGAAPALTDVVAGHIPMMFIATGVAAQPWRVGQVKPIGIGGSHRLAEFPNVPIIDETYPGYRAELWFGLFAPGGTPKEIVDKLNTGVQQVMADPAFKQRYIDANFFEAMTGKPEDLAKQIQADTAKWTKVIRDAKISIEE